ncbi:hypothetical protein PPYR_04352 [Photinus pyralis]|uniref:Uncharacterized protein n=1 Tax=Photinus pyralis TaxID=7054 RepID=A0A5N4AXX0_PHOPY|nr:uncharacterized protein LOC116163877 [Photinus pyralis]KAB0802166.1 hypothetical protein PPYR_04352 [Photinus pyralis]
MMKTFLLLICAVGAFGKDPPLQFGQDSYIDAYLETRNLNKVKINREISVTSDNNHGAGGYEYPAPSPVYGPSHPTYGPPPSYPIYGTPPEQHGIPFSIIHSLFDKLKFKLEIVTLLKILLKVILFKKFVSFVAILCLLLFIPWLSKKGHGNNHNGGNGDNDDGDYDDMRKLERRSIFRGDNLNNITVYVLEAIEKYASNQMGDNPTGSKCSSLYCRVNRIAKDFSNKFD